MVQATCCWAQVVWASRQQPAHLRVLSTARLLNRSHFPWVSLCCGGALWETHITRAHAAASSAGGRKPLSIGAVTAPLCASLLSELTTSDYYPPCSSGISLSNPNTPCPLCHSLCFSHLSAFFSVSSISLHYKHIFFHPGLLFTWMGFSLYAKGPTDVNP